jgi:hypothetical protein
VMKTFDAGDQDSKKHIVHCLPFVMTESDEDAVDDAIAMQALTQHKTCKCALMEPMCVQKGMVKNLSQAFEERDSAGSWTERKTIELETKVQRRGGGPFDSFLC